VAPPPPKSPPPLELPKSLLPLLDPPKSLLPPLDLPKSLPLLLPESLPTPELETSLLTIDSPEPNEL